VSKILLDKILITFVKNANIKIIEIVDWLPHGTSAQELTSDLFITLNSNTLT